MYENKKQPLNRDQVLWNGGNLLIVQRNWSEGYGQAKKGARRGQQASRSIVEMQGEGALVRGGYDRTGA